MVVFTLGEIKCSRSGLNEAKAQLELQESLVTYAAEILHPHHEMTVLKVVFLPDFERARGAEPSDMRVEYF